MKKILALIGILLIAAFVAGCAQKEEVKPTPAPEATVTPEETPAYKLVKPGVLTVGMDATYPPFEYINETTDEFEGFDVDLMKEIGKRLGLEVEFVNVAWEGIIPGLVAHKYDCICSAMTITEERKKQIDFSDPYFEAWQVIVVRADCTDITKPEDLAGKVVGVQIGTTGQFVAEDLVKSGINFEIKTYDTTPDALLDLKNGNIDAVIIDNGVAEKAIKNNPDVYKTVGGKLSYEEYGIAVAKDNPELLKAINQALKEVKEDGTYDKIYQKWFGE
ncbi:basic amino acid ABC transporter substrate-binding protein [Archaeoglobus veneficus]|uniref:ABC-type transporter, periplasmic subunit family 3 n=1 Tax=Archaeoglobus veneficus (strain DSM 11195 / SNP6) TaxID=693661 RepID=F2KSD6_ARCVS|nr:basic amino acid ABC transporter substrate-binding protein [Archaeoglobus veneficus]AEA46905.1 ABC-type transporter, periplasmic subunit family 3 [Archaeoglobus veneficus SNP6]